MSVFCAADFEFSLDGLDWLASFNGTGASYGADDSSLANFGTAWVSSHIYPLLVDQIIAVPDATNIPLLPES